MQNDNDNLQYNSCISKGICSVNPRTSALQNVLGLYLHICSKYCWKLYKKNVLDSEIKHFILNTVAISVANPEFTETCFMEVIARFKKILPILIETYNNTFDKEDFRGEDILASDIFKKSENIVEAIKFGERLLKNNVSIIPNTIRNIFKIMFSIAKSISINLMDLESYTYNGNSLQNCNTDKNAFSLLLKMLTSMSSQNTDIKKLKRLVYLGAQCNTKLMELLHNEQEKRYGEQNIVNVSYTTTPSKAVLAVGSNIRELETIIEALKETDIDIYTHDEMMVAHTFPKFSNYRKLKGQYGHGLENCLIDFATFPGPIILTKHSLHNIENFYRGRLFTTDTNFYNGVIKIENNNFEEVIKSANQAKGFKKGKICETVRIGYDYNECKKIISDKLNSDKYKKIVVIGLKDYSSKQKEYFENLVRLIADDILIISFSYAFDRENLLYFNTCFDSYAVVRIVSFLQDKNLPLDIFLPKCGKNTITEMIHFSKFEHNTIYIGECEPIMINPSIINTLKEVFNIKTIESVKTDSKEINKLSKDLN